MFDVGLAFVFWSFAAVTAVAFVFAYFLVPETKGRSLEEIEADLRDTVLGSEELAAIHQADESESSSASRAARIPRDPWVQRIDSGLALSATLD